MIVISTFYKFTPISNCQEVKNSLLSLCNSQQIKGTILLAEEGINATISGSREAISHFYQELEKRFAITLSNIKESFNEQHPFEKMKVRIKQEIVRIGIKEVDGSNPGHYVKPEDWDRFIQQGDVIVIDTRNDYEIEMGSFEKAINPHTAYFRDFPKWFEENMDQFAGKKVAMFCTGGVRCEKSTAYVKSKGIDEVYHLDGGILNYLEKMGNKGKTWHGNCFVFDERIALNNEVKPAFVEK